MHASQGKTLKMNPYRRRRRRRRSTGYARRGHRRYSRRRYRRNPGLGFFTSALKSAIPTLAGFLGNGLLVSKVGPMIPGVSALGSFQSIVLGGAALWGWDFASRKVSLLARHRAELMAGASLQVLYSVIKAFAPASVQALIGMNDYVAVGDYFAVGATPLNDQMTMSDYVAVGSDGVQEELGLEEELGVEEELGNDALLGGVQQGSLVAQVPSQRYLAPVPARSFTRQIPTAGAGYDNPNSLYTGIFAGRFGT